MTNDGIAVITGQLDDPVLAFEGPEELNFQLCIARIFIDSGFSFDVGYFSIAVTSIFYYNKSLWIQGVLGGRALTSFLKRLREGCDFIPFACVLF